MRRCSRAEGTRYGSCQDSFSEGHSPSAFAGPGSAAGVVPTVLALHNNWTSREYRWFRIAFGLYLIQHFVLLLPWGKEIFSSQGMLPDAGLSPFTRLFPNILAIADTPHAITALLVIAVIASALFCIGVADRLCAVLLWYMLACLFGRNPLISNPSLPFVGWMLLAH